MALQLGRNFCKCFTAMVPPSAHHRLFSSGKAINSKKGRLRSLVDDMEYPSKLGLAVAAGSVCGGGIAFVEMFSLGGGYSGRNGRGGSGKDGI